LSTKNNYIGIGVRRYPLLTFQID